MPGISRFGYGSTGGHTSPKKDQLITFLADSQIIANIPTTWKLSDGKVRPQLPTARNGRAWAGGWRRALGADQPCSLRSLWARRRAIGRLISRP